LARWRAANNRLSAERRKADLGVWMIRSTDDGVTWSRRYDALVNSPHGPTQLSDGRLLYAGKDLWRPGGRVGVCESTDDGQSWRWLSEIPVRDGDSRAEYHELHAVGTADGRIVCHVRNQNKSNSGETLQCESSDGGKTWTTPTSIGVWGLPSHLLRLKSNHLLMTCGHRRRPLGNQARLSTDHGRTWSDPIEVSGDGSGSDLGYPSTAELDDGTLISVWYEVMKGSPWAVLRQTKWRLG
jgi:sialidase-1